MSIQEKKRDGAIRIFEALSGVDQELLIRCEDSGNIIADKKVIRPIWYYGKTLAACLCFVVAGVLLWSVRPVLEQSEKGMTKDAAPETMMEEAAAVAVAVEEAAPEEADGGVPDYRYEKKESVTNGTPAEADVGAAGSASAAEDLKSQNQQLISDGLTESVKGCPAPMDTRKSLTLEEAKAVAALGEYVPDELPKGYVFEGANLTENETTVSAELLRITWLNGMDSIELNICFADENVVPVDVAREEVYNVHQYEIPYASTVPEEYRTVFNNPVFAAADLTQDIVEKRMKVVADAGDTDTPRGRLSVLYDDGVLVEFNGDAQAAEVYKLLTSVGH